MKKFLLLSITILTVTFLTAQNWVQKSNFPGVERYAATGFTINGKLYMGTGYNGVTMMNDWWEYDPATAQWAQKASFPGGGRFHASSFSINGKGYVLFGSTSVNPYNFPADLWEFDPVTNLWTQKANFPGQGRYTAVSLEINGKGYAGTGWRNGTFYNDWWEYNPLTNSWLQRSNLAGGTRQAAYGFVINNKGYVGLGSKTSTIFNDFYEYNPSSNSWIAKANFPSGSRSAGSSFAVNGYGYVGTGVDGEFGTTIYSDYHRYDPQLNNWTSINGFNPGRISPVVLTTSTCTYVMTGKTTSPTSLPTPQNTMKDMWEYCLATSVLETEVGSTTFNIYPNPWIDDLNIEFLASKTQNIVIELYNVLGQKVDEVFNGRVKESEVFIFILKDSNLSSGVYFIKIADEDTHFTTKIIKTKF